MATTYIYNLDHFILRVAVTMSKYLMGIQHIVLELKLKTAIGRHGDCVAVEGFSSCSSVQMAVSRIQAFQLLTKLCHMVKIHFMFFFIYKFK